MNHPAHCAQQGCEFFYFFFTVTMKWNVRNSESHSDLEFGIWFILIYLMNGNHGLVEALVARRGSSSHWQDGSVRLWSERSGQISFRGDSGWVAPSDYGSTLWAGYIIEIISFEAVWVINHAMTARGYGAKRTKEPQDYRKVFHFGSLKYRKTGKLSHA